MSKTPPDTPMMNQYRRAKAALEPNVLLFFRIGDFYEMFFDDAIRASNILGLTLTKRLSAPMCGIPCHAVDLYLAKLLQAGAKVAICDQMEDPALAKGLVRREITSIVTPGTVLNDAILDATRANYLAAVSRLPSGLCGLAMLDLSTGNFWMTETPSLDALTDDLARDAPPEIILPASLSDAPSFTQPLRAASPSTLTTRDDWTFDPHTAADFLCRHFAVQSLDGFGAADHNAAVSAAGALLHYVDQDLHRSIRHVHALHFRAPADAMLLDEATLHNLDLIAPPNTTSPTLFATLNATRTPMGSRLLHDWIVRPLRSLPAINARLDAVQTLVAEHHSLATLRSALSSVKDLERLAARLSSGSGNPRDARALALSLHQIPALQSALAPFSSAPSSGALAPLAQQIIPQNQLASLLSRAIVDEPPASIRDGGIFQKNYSPPLDALRSAATNGRQWIADLQTREIQRTGIKSLKIRFNRVFGYFIEVTRANLAQVPPDYQRKQTLANAERFLTPELKECEARILGADEKARALEYELFLALRTQIARYTAPIQQTARAIATLDVLASFADRAIANRYVRPHMEQSQILTIHAGRHPIIEQIPSSSRFVPNDAHLNGQSHQIALITGPNMAGKSTYIRQVALIVIMAQMGSFVPADSAQIGLADRVFTRVGAGDDIARGRSTFMVEMQETANILHNATAASLIILDEIGRGTSTFDGISIAWSVAEYLHNTPAVKARTLFATHYHELTDIALALPGVHNYNILVREQGDRIAFLRKIAPGPADKSYGIQVARLAGMPPPVVERAAEILANLEESELSPETGQAKLAQPRARTARPLDHQLSLFDESPKNMSPHP